MSHIAQWNFPTRIVLGPGRLKELPALCQSAGIGRPLVVTDRALATLPLMSEVRDVLAGAGFEANIYSHVDGNPTDENVTGGVQAFADMGADGVIGVGGGSALDVAKAVGLMFGQSRPLWDFEDVGDNYLRVDEAGMRPVIAIPTTAGTGSEVGRSSVITHREEGRKVIIFHPGMTPVAALLDPLLTTSLPAKLTATTGMDALSHLLEAYCATGFHPMADGMALTGSALVRDALPVAFSNGDDVEARTAMLTASLMGATAFQKGLGAMHAISHAVGARTGAHHGETNAVVMPYVLRHNLDAISSRLDDMARFLQLGSERANDVIDWTLKLRREFEIPDDLGALGVVSDDVSMLAEAAAKDPAGAGNPTSLDAAGYERLISMCLTGFESTS